MPVTKEFTERVVAQMSAARPIRHRPMFGGLGFYLDEAFFAVGDDDRLFFKVSSETAPLYEAHGMGPWFCAGVENLKYREVPSVVLDDPDTLGKWMDAAAAVARQKKK